MAKLCFICRNLNLPRLYKSTKLYKTVKFDLWQFFFFLMTLELFYFDKGFDEFR